VSPLGANGSWLADCWRQGASERVVIAPIDGGSLETALRGAVREARRLRAVPHPGVVPPSGVVALGDRPAVVSPYIPGVDLRSVANSRPPLSVALTAARRVARALASCHGVIDPHTEDVAPVVHGGLDASDVRITPEGRVRVVGFCRTAALRTPSDDVFAVGELLYHLLTGEPLEALPTSSWKHRASVLERILKLESAPESLLSLITRCLDWEPESRPVASAVALELEVLSATLDGPAPASWLPGVEASPAPAARPAPVTLPDPTPPTRYLLSEPRPAPPPRLSPALMTTEEEEVADPPTEPALLLEVGPLERLRIPRPTFMPRKKVAWKARLVEAPTPEELPAPAPALAAEFDLDDKPARRPARRVRPAHLALLASAAVGLVAGWLFFFSGEPALTIEPDVTPTAALAPAIAPADEVAPDREEPVELATVRDDASSQAAEAAIAALLAEPVAAVRKTPPVLVRVPSARDTIVRCGGTPIYGLSTVYIETPEWTHCEIDVAYADGAGAARFELDGTPRVLCQRAEGELSCAPEP